MKKITGRTRAKKDGTYIVCPHCNYSFPIFHFSWATLTCLKCKKVVDKKDWFLKDRSHKLPEVEKTTMPRVLIEVKKGCVVWVAATEDIEVVTADHDNIEAGDIETCQTFMRLMPSYQKGV
jgi:DNA-directed RNA polymerase subunit RPC12/RpoP